MPVCEPAPEERQEQRRAEEHPGEADDREGRPEVTQVDAPHDLEAAHGELGCGDDEDDGGDRTAEQRAQRGSRRGVSR